MRATSKIIELLSRLFVLMGLISIQVGSLHAQPKAIAVVVDNSGSMFGRQMENSVFALQMINSFKAENDVLGVFVNGELFQVEGEIISDQNRSFYGISKSRGSSLCLEITAAFPWLVEYAQEGYRTELIILSDGELRKEARRGVPFDCGKEFVDDFGNFFEETGANVHFAEIISGAHVDNCSVCDAFENFPFVNQQLIDVKGQPEALFDFLTELSFNLSDASFKGQIPLDWLDENIHFKTEFPLSKFTIYYLDREGAENMPSIQKYALKTGTELHILVQSTASLEGFTQPHWGNQQGHVPLKDKASVWQFSSKNKEVIPANSEVSLTFDKPVDANKIRIIPQIALTARAYPGQDAVLIDVQHNTYQACDTLQEIEVFAELLSHSDKVYTDDRLKNSRVYLKTGDKKHRMQFIGEGRFSVKVPVKKKVEWYSVTLEYDGYFYFQPRIFSIEKIRCREIYHLKEDNLPFVATLDLENLLSGDTICSEIFQLKDPQTGKAIKTSEIVANINQKPPQTDVLITALDEYNWQLCIFSTTNDCPCFAKSGKYPLSIVFKNKDVQGQSFIFVRSISFTLREPWYIRCFKEILVLITGILFLFYIIALAKKKRFNRRLKIIRTINGGQKQVRTLKGGFLNRYFNPFGAEQCAQFGYKFKAKGKKENTMLIDRKSVKPGTRLNGMAYQEPPHSDVILSVGKKVITLRDRVTGQKIEFDIET